MLRHFFLSLTPVVPLSFGHPAWLLALAAIVAGGFTWWIYRESLPPLPTGRRTLLGGLRFLVLAIILFLLFEPVWRQVSSSETPPSVAVLLDESQSIRVTTAAAGSARAATDTTSTPRVLQKALSQLETSTLDDAQLRFFSFSTAARRLPDEQARAVDSLRFSGTRTDLTNALRTVREQLEGENLQAIVLASDGQYNTGRNPLYWAERSPVPIHTIVLGDTSRQRDVVLRRAETNDLAYVGTEVPVRVGVQAEGYADETVQVSLWEGSERLSSERLSLPAGTAEHVLDLTFTPEEAGLKRLTVSVARLDGEATYRNNTRSLALRVLEQKRQVLLLAAAPSPNVSAIRRLLEADPSAAVTALISRQQGQFYGGPFPDSLSSFNVVVLAGYPGRAAPTQANQQLVEAIEAGLPVLFLMDRQTDLQALQQQFGEVLPAVPERIRTSSVQATFVPTAAGRRHPVLQDLLPSRPSSSNTWTQLPPLRKSQTRWQLAPDARTLGNARVRGVDTGDPLLLVRRRSGRRSAMLLGTGTWRWANLPEALSDVAPLWPGLLSNLVQWTSAAENDRPVRVEPAQPTFAGGETVRLTGQVYDSKLQPVEEASVEVILDGPDGNRYPFQMQSLGNGRYTLEAPALPSGRYTYEATAQDNGQVLGTDRGSFAVGQTTLEYQHTRANAALMRQIAQRSGGSFHTVEASSELPARIAAAGLEPLVTRSSQETPLWERYGFLLVALALLSTEWVLRRRSGMA